MPKTKEYEIIEVFDERKKFTRLNVKSLGYHEIEEGVEKDMILRTENKTSVTDFRILEVDKETSQIFVVEIIRVIKVKKVNK